MTARRLCSIATACLYIVCAGPPASAVDASDPRLIERARLPHGPASWLSLHAERVIFGAGRNAHLAQTGPAMQLRAALSLASPASEAVLVENRLYTLEDGELRVRVLEALHSPGWPIELSPGPSGSRRIARMDDFLVVAEDGFGLRWIEMVFHDHDGADHHAMRPDLVRNVSILAVADRFSALGSSFRKMFVATESGNLLVIDARDPGRPLLVDELVIGRRLDAIAARGDTVFALGEGRLLVFDVTDEAAGEIVWEQPAPGARAIAVAGRTVYVAGDEGLTVFRDASEIAANIPVTVASNFFSPANVAIDVGDTVVWEKFNLGFHNVESCDGVGIDPAGCAGNVSPDGSWSSGSPTSENFTFLHAFANPGEHRYFCVVHSALGMNGSVAVAAPALDPPTVPDGAAGMPVRVGKGDATGSQLIVEFDDATCSDTQDLHLLFGGSQTLPASLGGVYGLDGAACDTGATSPFVWTSPDPSTDPRGLIWFLLVADDGVDTEGGWGSHSGGAERDGPGAGGVSGLCGMTVKSLTNTCGR